MSPSPAEFREHPILWTPERVDRMWSFYATHLPASNYFSRHSGGHILRQALRYIPELSSREILDFGCGPGYLIEHLLAKRGTGRVSGHEFSEQTASAVRQRFAENARFSTCTSAHVLPTQFAPGSFDVVFCVEVIEHLTDAQLVETLTEIRRLLRPTGKLVLTTPNAEDLAANLRFCPECGCVFHPWQHVRSWSCDSLQDLLARSGLQPIAVRALYFASRQETLVRVLKQLIRRTLFPRLQPAPLPHLFAMATPAARRTRPSP